MTRADLSTGTAKPRVKRDGLILDGLDGRCILVRGTALPETLERAREWAAEDGYVLTDPDAVRLQWIRAVPCPQREHSHDGYPCDQGPGVWYYDARAGRGAFQGIIAFIAAAESAGGRGMQEERRAGQDA